MVVLRAPRLASVVQALLVGVLIAAFLGLAWAGPPATPARADF